MAKKKVKREKYEVYALSARSWSARQVGAPRDGARWFIHSYPKAEAVKRAIAYAKSRAPSQLFIKGRNGKIQSERTYGDDPRRFKG